MYCLGGCFIANSLSLIIALGSLTGLASILTVSVWCACVQRIKIVLTVLGDTSVLTKIQPDFKLSREQVW